MRFIGTVLPLPLPRCPPQGILSPTAPLSCQPPCQGLCVYTSSSHLSHAAPSSFYSSFVHAHRNFYGNCASVFSSPNFACVQRFCFLSCREDHDHFLPHLHTHLSSLYLRVGSGSPCYKVTPPADPPGLPSGAQGPQPRTHWLPPLLSPFTGSLPFGL